MLKNREEARIDALNAHVNRFCKSAQFYQGIRRTGECLDVDSATRISDQQRGRRSQIASASGGRIQEGYANSNRITIARSVLTTVEPHSSSWNAL